MTVRANLEELGAIGAFVLKAAEKAGIDKRAAYRLRLAVDEIATNVITHGRPGELGLHDVILLQAEIDDKALTITLDDHGPAFDPMEHTTPEEILAAPIHERPIGGLGVFLAVRGVDEFKYQRIGERNRNVFVVNRPHG